jgi:REP element-mobilizing transposase RayT
MLKRHFHKRTLPHLYYNEGTYFVTYRLYDSIHPDELKNLQKLIDKYKKFHPNEREKVFKKYDSLLDKPANKIQYLKQPQIREICKKAIHYYENKEYKLICYCIMPNHVHIVIDLINNKRLLGDILGSVKKYGARRANKVLCKKGKFWQSESFDRLVRDERELYYVIRYVLMNPVNAGLVNNWKEWKGTYCRPEYQVID